MVRRLAFNDEIGEQSNALVGRAPKIYGTGAEGICRRGQRVYVSSATVSDVLPAPVRVPGWSVPWSPHLPRSLFSIPPCAGPSAPFHGV